MLQKQRKPQLAALACVRATNVCYRTQIAPLYHTTDARKGAIHLQWLQAVLYVWLRVLNRLADSAPHNSGVRGEAEICAASKQVAHTANWKALAIGYASCT